MPRIVLSFLALAVALLLSSSFPSQAETIETRGSWPSFGIKGDEFIRAGKPYQIISGAIHFQRIPRAHWHDRLLKARAMGLNTVETYVFWNLVEPRSGQFDFSGNNDIAAFVDEAAALGLNVILRPGPYVCAEWEAGGYPAWLWAQPGMRVRSLDPRFIAASNAYIWAVADQVRSRLNGNGGPIIAVQVENEYGSFDNDKTYLQVIRKLFVEAGFDKSLLFTSDGADMLANGSLPGTMATVNFSPGEAQAAFDKLRKFRPGQPLMAGEYWAGWFDHWGKPHARTNSKQQAEELEWMLRQGHSVNLYMFNGGTTFGFMSGANFQSGIGERYSPQTSSYDYDAALDEAGRPTAKFTMLREAISRATGKKLPQLPPEQALSAPAPVVLRESASLWDNLPQPSARSEDPQPMEQYGQNYGYIVYRTKIMGPRNGSLYLGEVRDYARIYLDRKLLGSVERRLRQTALEIDIPAGEHTLDVLVENSGRVNYGARLIDGRAGLVDPVFLNGFPLKGWQSYTLPMDVPQLIRGWTTAAVDGPAFRRGMLQISTPADTFLDLRTFGKGFTWANGHNLGRHWSIGPQRSLYFPGPWQQNGDNEIIVFDLDSRYLPQIGGQRQPIWSTSSP